MNDQTASHSLRQGPSLLGEEGPDVGLRISKCVFAAGQLQPIVRDLESHQNKDGGFGPAFESDVRSPDSTAYGTSETCYYIKRFGLGSDHPMVQKAVRYFVDSYDTDLEA